MKKSSWSVIIVASVIVVIVLGFSLYKVIDYSKNKTIAVTVNYGFDVKDSYTLMIGETLNINKTPEKEGYVFVGWYQDEACTKEFDFSKKIKKETTIYAKWTNE